MVYSLLAVSGLMNIFLCACCIYLAYELKDCELMIEKAKKLLEEDIKEKDNGTD